MVELSLSEDGSNAQIGFAGDTLNTAIYLKRAAPEIDVSYITRLGRDAFSDRLRDFIASEGVATDRIETSETRQVGLYSITTDPTGERSFCYWRSHSAARELFQASDGEDFAALEGFDAVFLSAITLAVLPDRTRSALFRWLGAFRRRGGRVAFDSNYRPALWEDLHTARARIGEAWQLTDIALPSVDDEMAIFGDADAAGVIARLSGYGVEEGALKCGSGGPMSMGEPVDQSYPAAEHVVDTTAAGDSFNGGYLAAHLSGKEQRQALMAGHRLAAFVVGHTGAIAPNDVGDQGS